MAGATSSKAEGRPSAKPFSAWWLVGWGFAAVILIAGFGQAALHQNFSDPDNAMRLVRVRDFLGGQAWFDPVEHRLNPPDGTPMHWARWIDAAIAAPIAVLSPIVGQQGAEIAVSFIWPLGLLAIFMALVAKVSGELGERDNMRRETEIAGVIVAALAFPAIEKFAPGSFDHHNIELILTLLAALCLMRMHEKPRAGAIAGLALGAATATAAESAPMLAAGLLIAGLLWLVRPKDYAPGLAWFGSGLAFSSLISFFVLVSPADWGRPVCDAMSTPFLGLGLIGGGIAVALGLAPESLTSTFARRVGASAVLSGIGGVSLALLFPECRGGGYAALNADMETLWMSQISETRSLFSLVGDNIALACATGGAALAGLVAAGLYLWRRWKKPEGWIVFGFLLAAWAILAWQIRGATFATTLAIPFGAWAIARARRNYQIKTSALRLVVFAGVAASSAAAAWASAGQVLQNQIMPRKTMVSFKTRSEDAKDCTSPAAFAPLNSLPAGVVLNQFSLGADVLLWTKHSVLAGPYHRDVTGTMTAINALRSSSQQAREIIAGSVADYVLVCPALSETMFYAHHATAGVVPEATLSMKLAEDEPPDWLKAVPLKDTPLKLYRVKR